MAARTCVLLLLPAIGGVLCTCNRPGESRAAPPAAVASWFWSPSAASPPGTTVAPDAFDSVVDSLRGTGARGTLAADLRDSAGVTYKLGISAPTDTQSRKLPLIVYLHGGTGTMLNTKGELAFQMLSALADTMPLLLASPSANRLAPWWGPIGLSRILQTVRFMTLHYPVDSSRIFLAGVSDGATGCYAAANTIPGPFAGFIAISGYGGMLPGFGLQLHPQNLMQRPIYNVNGGRDHLYPVEQVNRFVQFLRENGVEVISKVYPDEKHGFDYRDREMGNLAGLLRTWTRPPFRGIAWTFTPGFPNVPDNLVAWEYSAPARGYPLVNGFIRADTLVLQTEGVSALTLGIDAPIGGARVNGTPARLDTAPHAALLAMRMSCYPALPRGSSLYTISLPRR